MRPAFWLSFSGSFAWALSGPALVDLTTPDQPVARPVRPLERTVPSLLQGQCGPLKPPPRLRKSPSEKPEWRAPERPSEKPQRSPPEPLLGRPPAAAKTQTRWPCQPSGRVSLYRPRSVFVGAG